MPRSSRSLVVPALAGLLVVFLAFLGGSRSAQVTGPAPSPVPLRHHFVAGRTLVYELTRETADTDDVTALLPPGAQPAPGAPGSVDPTTRRQELHGRLEITSVGVTEDGAATLWVRVRAARVDGHDAPALAEGILVDVDARGRVTAWRPARTLGDADAVLIHGLAVAAQVVLPDDPEAARWSAAEARDAGQILFDYRRTPGEAGEVVLERHAARVLAANLRGGGALDDGDLQLELASADRIRLDAARTIVLGIVGERRVTVRVAGARVLHVRDERLVVDLVEERHDDLLPAPDEFTAPPPPLRPAPAAAPTADRDDGTTWDDLLAALDEAWTLDDDGKRALVRRVGAWLARHPEAAVEAGVLLAALEADSAEAQLVGLALAGAGHGPAQAALAGAISAWHARGERSVSHVVLLAGMDEPGAVVLDTLRRLATDDELGSAATLGIGRAARRLAASDPSAAERLVAELADELAGAPPPPPGRRVLLLAALGNTRSASALPAIRAALVDPEASVRGAAAFALRFVSGAEADAWLARLAADDPSPEVRARAAQAQAYRRPGAVNP